jgi:antibiotic biosynthesis monooxygenase (ABM) superfamily enzyme
MSTTSERNQGSAAPVLELVVFSLKPGTVRDEFLYSVEAVSRWLSGQPGFVSRELAHDTEGDRWIDLVRWADLATAKASVAAAVKAPECAPMFGLIDADRMLFLHGQPVIEPVTAS